MNKNCARCNKIVYPIEELKCLDKTWHKTCFRCHECGMTLNMKTYKGFEKLPYCEAHIPKAKATVIADTPEIKRIAENTKIQSNVKYHADFEKNKGKLTQVADDPETLRIKQNTLIISNVAYHGDLEKKAAMEKQRETAEISDNRESESEYFSETLAAESLSQYQKNTPSAPPHHAQQQHQLHKQQQQNYVSNNMPHKQQQPQQQQLPQQQQSQQNVNYQTHSYSQQQQQQPNYSNIRSSVVQSSLNPSGAVIPNVPQNNQPKYYDQYDNYARPTSHAINNNNVNSINNNVNSNYYNYNNNNNNNNNNMNTGGNSYQYQSSSGGHNNNYNQILYSSENAVSSGGGVGGGGNAGNIGKISDYDPLTDGPRNIPNTTRPSSTLIYSSDRSNIGNNNPQQRRIGSVHDIDPANGIYGSVVNEQNTYQQQSQARQSQKPQQQISSTVRVFRALYDYEAQDSDEVSFVAGDIIFEVISTYAGWMTGRIDRTGKTGMLPANYVAPAVI